MSRILVCIPAHNEADNIADMVREWATVGDVLVVDDGSTDGTWQIASEAGAGYYINPVDSQYGDGITKGFSEYFQYGDWDTIITVNAGRTHPMPVGIAHAISAVQCPEPRIVFGWRRKMNIVSFTCGLIMELMTNSAVKDYSSFRVMNRAAVEKMLPHLPNFGRDVYTFCPQFCYVSWKLGINIDHLLITRIPKKSSLNLWKFLTAGIGLVRIWWRYK